MLWVIMLIIFIYFIYQGITTGNLLGEILTGIVINIFVFFLLGAIVGNIGINNKAKELPITTISYSCTDSGKIIYEYEDKAHEFDFKNENVQVIVGNEEYIEIHMSLNYGTINTFGSIMFFSFDKDYKYSKEKVVDKYVIYIKGEK